MTFDHNGTNNTDDFKGYDLYYKLYPPPNAAISSTISADESYIETTPRDTGPRRLQARGFLRLVPVTNRVGDNSETVASLITSDPRPSIPMDPTASSVTFSVDLREPSQRPDSSVDGDPFETEIVVSDGTNATTARGFRRRNSSVVGVSRPDDFYASFWDASSYTWDVSQNDDDDDEEPNDEDSNDDQPNDEEPDTERDLDLSRMFSGTTFDLSGDFNFELTIVLYVIAYGVDGTTFQPYYSEPLRLNEATIVVSDN